MALDHMTKKVTGRHQARARREPRERGLLLLGDAGDAGGARKDQPPLQVEVSGALRPKILKGGADGPGRAFHAIDPDRAHSCDRGGTTLLGMLPCLKHQEGRAASWDKAAFANPLEDRRERAAPQHAVHRIVKQNVGPLGIARAAHEENVALARADTSHRDPQRVDTSLLLAYQSAGAAGEAVNDRDIAGK